MQTPKMKISKNLNGTLKTREFCPIVSRKILRNGCQHIFELCSTSSYHYPSLLRVSWW